MPFIYQCFNVQGYFHNTVTKSEAPVPLPEAVLCFPRRSALRRRAVLNAATKEM